TVVTLVDDSYPRRYVSKDNITGRIVFDSELNHLGN
ncbi:MAG: hypothetical protein ACI92S_003530, partial [Planctomycetaceae bacterium]